MVVKKPPATVKPAEQVELGFPVGQYLAQSVRASLDSNLVNDTWPSAASSCAVSMTISLAN